MKALMLKPIESTWIDIDSLAECFHLGVWHVLKYLSVSFVSQCHLGKNVKVLK